MWLLETDIGNFDANTLLETASLLWPEAAGGRKSHIFIMAEDYRTIGRKCLAHQNSRACRDITACAEGKKHGHRYGENAQFPPGSHVINISHFISGYYRMNG
jgi:hypothetical protein